MTAAFALTAPQPTVSVTAPSVTPTEAILQGSANPNGQAVLCSWAYESESESERGGLNCGERSGDQPVPMNATIVGLTPSTWYRARLTVANGGPQDVYSSWVHFHTPALKPPVVKTLAPTGVTATSATLRGTVNPRGHTLTTCEIEFGPTTHYDHFATCPQPYPSGSTRLPCRTLPRASAPARPIT